MNGAPFSHVYDDHAAEFLAREAAADERRAAHLSRLDGRHVDANGFAKSPASAEALARIRHSLVGQSRSSAEALRRRLQVTRWTNEVRAAAEQKRKAAREEFDRGLLEALEIPTLRELQTVAEMFPDAWREINKSPLEQLPAMKMGKIKNKRVKRGGQH